jgi:hypothetical protein
MLFFIKTRAESCGKILSLARRNMRLRADYFLSIRQGGAIDFKLIKESAFIFNKRAEKGGIIFLYTQNVSHSFLQ